MSPSDIRLKKNIKPIANGMNLLETLKGVTFEWKKDGGFEYGFIAQEVEKSIPQLVVTGNDDMKSVKYGNITAILVEAVKQQNQEIRKLKQEIEELSRQIKTTTHKDFRRK